MYLKLPDIKLGRNATIVLLLPMLSGKIYPEDKHTLTLCGDLKVTSFISPMRTDKSNPNLFDTTTLFCSLSLVAYSLFI